MTTEEEVVALVAKKTGISVTKITPEKTFYQLGIDGDDAVELIDELCERYKVPVEGVDLRRYLGPEAGFGVISHIFSALIRKSHVEPEERKELRISDLVKTAEDHRWFDLPLVSK
jgi:acyl carrier protein